MISVSDVQRTHGGVSLKSSVAVVFRGAVPGAGVGGAAEGGPFPELVSDQARWASIGRGELLPGPGVEFLLPTLLSTWRGWGGKSPTPKPVRERSGAFI